MQELADAHLSTAVSPLLDKILGKNAPKKRGKRRSEDAAYCDDSDDAEVEAEDDDGEEVAEAELLGEVKPPLPIADKQQASSSSRSSGSDPRPAPPGRASSSRRQPHQAPESSDHADGGAEELQPDAQRATDDAEARKAAEDAIVEDAWMVSTKDGRKGRVVRAGRWGARQQYQLRDQSGSLGTKKYSALDLKTESLDFVREQKVAAPFAALLGARASMWWRSPDDDAGGNFWPGVLRASSEPGQRACKGVAEGSLRGHADRAGQRDQSGGGAYGRRACHSRLAKDAD